MKMEQRVTRIIYILIYLAFVNEMLINVQAKDNKRRPKEKISGFQKNICDITDRESKVHCYCENTRELRNASKAECWVFNGGILRDDIIWQSFTSQPNLQTLSFSVRVDGAFGYVPTKALQYLNNLRSFSIRYGTITNITPYAFANLTNLTEITLTQNEIETFHQYAFAHLPNITLINLEDNMIIEINTDVFYEVPKLKKLMLTKNNISSIKDGAFQYMFNLQELLLNKNSIFHLNRRTFDGLANLRKLDLRRNRIYNLTEFTFAELWNLQELLLGKNDLKYISERAFDGLSQLKNLSLDNNKLAVLPAGLFAGVRGLTSLDLRSNELHALTLDDITPILDNLKPQNSNLLLEENNFICDCRLKWMYLLSNETKSRSTKLSMESITCKMDPTITSAAYNKMSDVKENKMIYNQEILHAGISIETINEKMNVTEKNIIHDKFTKDKDINEMSVTKKSLKRNILKIPPENLPCPKDTEKSTDAPQLIMHPVMPVQNEMKTYRYQEMNSARKLLKDNVVILLCFSIYLTQA
ncbi:leucine rich repeat protein connectin [Aphomia sociella]